MSLSSYFQDLYNQIENSPFNKIYIILCPDHLESKVQEVISEFSEFSFEIITLDWMEEDSIIVYTRPREQKCETVRIRGI